MASFNNYKRGTIVIKKYSKEFKLQVVKFYDEHPELGYLSVSREFNIPSDETVRKWVKLYQAHGEAGLEKIRTTPCKNHKRSSWMDPQTAQERIAYLEAENDYLKKLMLLRKVDD